MDITPCPKHAINTDKKKFLFPGSTFFSWNITEEWE